MIAFQIKAFNELSVHQLYQILGLRNEVFIVEQNCVYQDIDFKDDKALHVVGYLDEALVCYARIFKPNDYLPLASIGRVIVSPQHRKRDFGNMLVREAILGIEKHFNEKEIEISAQCYLIKFYESHGFAKVGEVYLEDNIPHIKMIKACLPI